MPARVSNNYKINQFNGMKWRWFVVPKKVEQIIDYLGPFIDTSQIK